MVAKSAFLEALWPGRFVEENSLARVISDLRKALGPDAGCIGTVQGRGYRLNADVRAAMAKGAADVSMKRTLAILPFVELGGGEAEKQSAVGLADALITRLSGLRNVVIRPTISIAGFADGKTDPVDAGRRLRVSLVLCGSMRRQGEMIRCSLQLVEVETEASVWASRFDEPATSLFAFEDAIAARVAPLLASELERGELPPTPARGTDDAKAYVLAQRGRYWLAQRRAPDSIAKAIECFTAAVARDPGFAQAHAGLAQTYVLGGIHAFTIHIEPPRKMIPLARASARQALLLNPDLSEAHEVLAHVALSYDWDWRAAEAAFRHALRLNPANASAHATYAVGLCSSG